MMAEYRYLAKPHPEWTDFPNNLPKHTRVCGMSRERKPITPHPDLSIEEFDVPARDGYGIGVRSYKANNVDGQLPLFFYLHGGGFVTGGLETDDASCRAIAIQVPVMVLNVEYRLAPEHKFPVGFEDSFDALRWVTSEEGQDRLSINLDNGFILGGTSAGANFTAGIAHLARDEGLVPKVTGLVFLAGSFCHPDSRPTQYLDRILSVDEINDAPGLTRKSIDYFADKYGAPPSDFRLSPLLFDSHAGLANKAFFAVCGWDPRRDEALLFEHLLRTYGIETKLHVYPGLPHGFWTTCPDLPVSRSWEADLVAGVKWLLSSK